MHDSVYLFIYQFFYFLILFRRFHVLMFRRFHSALIFVYNFEYEFGETFHFYWYTFLFVCFNSSENRVSASQLSTAMIPTIPRKSKKTRTKRRRRKRRKKKRRKKRKRHEHFYLFNGFRLFFFFFWKVKLMQKNCCLSTKYWFMGIATDNLLVYACVYLRFGLVLMTIFLYRKSPAMLVVHEPYFNIGRNRLTLDTMNAWCIFSSMWLDFNRDFGCFSAHIWSEATVWFLCFMNELHFLGICAHFIKISTFNAIQHHEFCEFLELTLGRICDSN